MMPPKLNVLEPVPVGVGFKVKRTFIEDYKRRLGVAGSTTDSITVLRSVVADPWITETAKGSFIDTLENELRKAVLEALEEIAPKHTRGY